jgi:hypothetical protein
LEADDYLPLVEILARVTAHPRDFTVHGCHGRNFGFSRGDLAMLARAGLPHLRANGEHLFRWGDLHYLGLRLGIAKPYLAGIGRWGKTFAQLSQSRRTDVAVDYIPKLSPANRDGVIGTVRLPGGGRRIVVLRPGEVGATIRTRRYGAWPAPDPRLAAILERFAKLQLYVIPESLRESPEQLMELGLSDCESVARLVVVACTRERYEARAAYGLLLSFPFSVPHSWAEVRIEDTWMSFDPLTAMAMREFAREETPRVTGSSCLGAILLRIAGERLPLVSADGVCMGAIFATRRVS